MYGRYENFPISKKEKKKNEKRDTIRTSRQSVFLEKIYQSSIYRDDHLLRFLFHSR